jgi:hypothetical protein
MKTTRQPGKPICRRNRTGSASIDYMLILAVILPLAALLTTVVPRMIKLVYEMTILVIGIPLM